MSNLRILGLIIGLIGLISTFLRYRGAKWNRSSFILFSLFSSGLIILAIDPDVVNFLRDLLLLQSLQHSRLIVLIIISVLILFLISFYSYSKLEIMRSQIDRLFRAMAAKNVDIEIKAIDKVKPIVILIPAFNEEKNLTSLLPMLPQEIVGLGVSVFVIDDGSEDKTVEVVNEHSGIAVSNMINRGGGAALRLGYDIVKKLEVRICVTMDSDGQHKPDEISNLVKPVLNNECDIAIGSRILGGREKDSFVRLMGVYFFSFVLNRLMGTNLTDPSNGFRAFRTDILNEIQLKEDQYHTSELIIEAIRKGFNVKEVPVTILKRKYGRSKKGKEIFYGLHFAKVILKTWWRR